GLDLIVPGTGERHALQGILRRQSQVWRLLGSAVHRITMRARARALAGWPALAGGALGGAPARRGGPWAGAGERGDGGERGAGEGGGAEDAVQGGCVDQRGGEGQCDGDSAEQVPVREHAYRAQ